MNSTILYTILSLCTVGLLAGVILYFVAKKFHVQDDPRVSEVEKALPGVNCGTCGYPGCHAFAEAVAKADDLTKMYCPAGGNECMAVVVKILGKEMMTKEPMVAVVRCYGTPEHSQRKNRYDGSALCVIAHNYYMGETDCPYGCLGLGDCVVVCPFDAIYMDETTQLPIVDQDKCTACGACVKACPRDIIELRKKGPKARRIYVCCINKDKGGVARKACSVACIGCGKCVKECPFNAITLENNLAYIDDNKCKLCRKCVVVCPTHAIHEINFPPRKPKETEEQSPIVNSNDQNQS
ncbi:MAG: Fe-S cluster domain-containing protein [Candidatus Omnitrophota bacterium]